MYSGSTEEIDRVALEENNTQVSLYNADGAVLYSASRSSIDSMVFTRKPVADVLDVVFKTDGTAEDVSPMKNVVATSAGGALTTYYNGTYRRFVAKFSNTWAGATSGYYRVDYANNQAFKAALADGHTLEAVVMADYTAPIANGEAKFFASHERGGTGLMVCKTNNGMNGQNELTFLPNVSTTGSSTWRWATTGIVPQPQVYYHIIGVWDKEAGEARVYVNGELKNTVAAEGDLVFPASTSNWLAIGCDAGPTAQLGWIGDVVVARIYDAPLTSQEVAVLWEEVSSLQNNPVPDMVSQIDFISGIAVKVGATYTISGQGFAEGDQIIFTSIANEADTYTLACDLVGDTGVEVTIPGGFASGQYRMMLTRGEAQQDLGLTTLEVVEEMPRPAEVIAHRGYWDTEGSAQNSLTAIRKAQELNLYGSELDVWLTTDGYIMLNHDASLGGVTFQDATYDQVKDLTLSNGEKVPQLIDCINLVKESDSPTKLIIEIKTHSTAERNMAAAEAVVNQVKEAGAQDKVEYIAFDLEICKKLAQLDPEAKVAYLSGGMGPATLHGYGITGLDYNISEFRNNPQWIQQAKELGMTVNVWTVNSMGDMAEMTNAGVQFITTDKPLEALKVAEYYKEMLKPVANLLDIVFHADGTAEDVSPMKNAVETNLGDAGALTTYYNEAYGRQVAKFNNTWAGSTTGYYKVDYADNEAFRNALANGHTIEAVVMAAYEPPIENKETKFFSSHERGGTGLMVCKVANGLNGQNELCFLPHVGSGWKFAPTGVVPEPQVYYHLVGVWNKEEGKAYVYLDGELKNTVDAAGELTFAADGSDWFCIGGDSGPTAQLGWIGEVVLARIYDAPLTSEEVTGLWEELNAPQPDAAE